MSLKSIVKKLANFAKHNEERAFSILGHRPGPGHDILIQPIEPLCGKYFAKGITPCGAAFVEKFWQFQPMNNQQIAELRKQATDWGLTFRTEYQILPLDHPSVIKTYID
jgi:hypothetical protein